MTVTAHRRLGLVGAVLCLLAPSVLLAQTDQRVALVVGNGAYQHAPLEHPPREAAAMARALTECGFRVITRINCTRQDMMQVIRDFGDEIQRGGVGLFYYGGHGVQVEGQNYLIPVGADIQGEEDVEFEAVDARRVLAAMERAGNRVNLMILDACRNNPYQSSFMSPSRGLLKMGAPTGTLLAYSTAPGDVAVDGVYTPALIEQMTTPGLPLSQVFIKTRIAVMARTGDSQVPWESTSLTDDFPFVPAVHYDDQIEKLEAEIALKKRRRAEELQQELDALRLPDWFLTPPSHPSYIFAAAAMASRDMNLSIQKAETAAKTKLASQLGEKLGNVIKQFQEEAGVGEDSELLQQFRSAIKVITMQTLTGARTRQRKVVPEKGTFRSYVLMSLPIGAANKALMDKIKANQNLYIRFRATRAFDEFNKELKAYEEGQ